MDRKLPGKGRKAEQRFLIPFDGSYVNEMEWEEGVEEVDLKELATSRICTSSLCQIIQVGRKRFSSAKKAATTTTVAPKHGNTGRKRRRSDEDPIIIALVQHFEKLLLYGEVEATRYVRLITGLLETQDKDDKIKRLPSSMTKRGCYKEYLKMNNYKLVEKDSKGNFKLK